MKSNQLKAKCVQQLNNWLNVYSIKITDLLNGRRVKSQWQTLKANENHLIIIENVLFVEMMESMSAKKDIKMNAFIENVIVINVCFV
jgi:hypothetical protein